VQKYSKYVAQPVAIVPLVAMRKKLPPRELRAGEKQISAQLKVQMHHNQKTQPRQLATASGIVQRAKLASNPRSDGIAKGLKQWSEVSG